MQAVTGDLYNVDEDILKSIYIYKNIGPRKRGGGAHCGEEFSDRLVNRQQYCMTGMRDYVEGGCISTTCHAGKFTKRQVNSQECRAPFYR